MMIWKRKEDAERVQPIYFGCSHEEEHWIHGPGRIYITVANDGRTVTVAEIETNPLCINCIDMTREEFDENFKCMANIKATRES